MADTATSLKKAATVRLQDAEALLSADRYSAACYLAGYVVEMLLKAVVLREYELMHRRPADSESVDSFSNKMKASRRPTLRDHDPKRLFGIYSSYSRSRSCMGWYNRGLTANCAVLVSWSEKWRYENGWIPTGIDRNYAESFLRAVREFRDLIRSEVG